MSMDEDTRQEEAPLQSEMSDLSLERRFAMAALTGIMPWAMQHQKSETEVARMVWRFAREAMRLETEELEEEAPPPPPRQAARGPQAARPRQVVRR